MNGLVAFAFGRLKKDDADDFQSMVDDPRFMSSSNFSVDVNRNNNNNNNNTETTDENGRENSRDNNFRSDGAGSRPGMLLAPSRKSILTEECGTIAATPSAPRRKKSVKKKKNGSMKVEASSDGSSSVFVAGPGGQSPLHDNDALSQSERNSYELDGTRAPATPKIKRRKSNSRRGSRRASSGKSARQRTDYDSGSIISPLVSPSQRSPSVRKIKVSSEIDDQARSSRSDDIGSAETPTFISPRGKRRSIGVHIPVEPVTPTPSTPRGRSSLTPKSAGSKSEHISPSRKGVSRIERLKLEMQEDVLPSRKLKLHVYLSKGEKSPSRRLRSSCSLPGGEHLKSLMTNKKSPRGRKARSNCISSSASVATEYCLSNVPPKARAGGSKRASGSRSVKPRRSSSEPPNRKAGRNQQSTYELSALTKEIYSAAGDDHLKRLALKKGPRNRRASRGSSSSSASVITADDELSSSVQSTTGAGRLKRSSSLPPSSRKGALRSQSADTLAVSAEDVTATPKRRRARYNGGEKTIPVTPTRKKGSATHYTPRTKKKGTRRTHSADDVLPSLQLELSPEKSPRTPSRRKSKSSINVKGPKNKEDYFDDEDPVSIQSVKGQKVTQGLASDPSSMVVPQLQLPGIDISLHRNVKVQYEDVSSVMISCGSDVAT